jgi:hypothetical protein
MAAPTVIDIHHSLGRAEAKRRMQAKVGGLASRIPGGMADVSSSWPTPDRMALEVTAMGQTIPVTLDVEDAVIHVTMLLPGMLGMMSGLISGVVKREGESLMIEDKAKG